jgi:hypothetical protein
MSVSPMQVSPCLFWNSTHTASCAVFEDIAVAQGAVTFTPGFATSHSERSPSISFGAPPALADSESLTPGAIGGFTPLQSIDLLADLLCTPMATGCEESLKLDDYLMPVCASLAQRSPGVPITRQECVEELAVFVEHHSEAVHKSKCIPLVNALRQAGSAAVTPASPALNIQPVALSEVTPRTASNPTPVNTPAGSAIKAREPSPITVTALLQCAGRAALAPPSVTPTDTPVPDPNIFNPICSAKQPQTEQNTPTVRKSLRCSRLVDPPAVAQTPPQVLASPPRRAASASTVAKTSGASWQALNAAIASDAAVSAVTPIGMVASEQNGMPAGTSEADATGGLMPQGTTLALQPFEFCGSPMTEDTPHSTEGPETVGPEATADQAANAEAMPLQLQASEVEGPPAKHVRPADAPELPRETCVPAAKTTPITVAPWEFGGTPPHAVATHEAIKLAGTVASRTPPSATEATPLLLSPLEFGSSTSAEVKGTVAPPTQTPLVLMPGEFGSMSATAANAPSAAMLVTNAASPKSSPVDAVPDDFRSTPSMLTKAEPSTEAEVENITPEKTPIVVAAAEFGSMSATASKPSSPLPDTNQESHKHTPLIIVPAEFGDMAGSNLAGNSPAIERPTSSGAEQTAAQSPVGDTDMAAESGHAPSVVPPVLVEMATALEGERTELSEAVFEDNMLHSSASKDPIFSARTGKADLLESTGRDVSTPSAQSPNQTGEHLATVTKHEVYRGSSSPVAAVPVDTSPKEPSMLLTPQASGKRPSTPVASGDALPSALCGSSQAALPGNSPKGTPLLQRSPLRFQSSAAAKPETALKARNSHPPGSPCADENAAPAVSPVADEGELTGGRKVSAVTGDTQDSAPKDDEARATRPAARAASASTTLDQMAPRSRKRKQPANTKSSVDGAGAGTSSTVSTQRTRARTARAIPASRKLVGQQTASSRTDSGGENSDSDAELEAQVAQPADAKSGKKRKVVKRQPRGQGTHRVTSADTASVVDSGPARRTRAASASMSSVSKEAGSEATTTSGGRRATLSSRRSQQRACGPTSKGVTKTSATATSKRTKPQLHNSVDAELQTMLDSKYEPKLSVICEVGEENIHSQAPLPCAS